MQAIPVTLAVPGAAQISGADVPQHREVHGSAALAAAVGALVLAQLHPDAAATRAARTAPSTLPEPSRGTAQ